MRSMLPRIPRILSIIIIFFKSHEILLYYDVFIRISRSSSFSAFRAATPLTCMSSRPIRHIFIKLISSRLFSRSFSFCSLAVKASFASSLMRLNFPETNTFLSIKEISDPSAKKNLWTFLPSSTQVPRSSRPLSRNSSARRSSSEVSALDSL